MNEWKLIWHSYHHASSREALFKDVINKGSMADNIYLTILLTAFLIGAIAHFYYLKTALVILFLSEIALIFELDKRKKKLVFNEYGGIDGTRAPPDTGNHKETRYLMFRKSLSDESVTKSHVLGCFDLVDLQIDIASATGIVPKKFMTFVLGVISGILVSFWRNLDTEKLIFTGVSILVVGLLITVILWMFPSKTEKLKEMKYFMSLYCKEIE